MQQPQQQMQLPPDAAVFVVFRPGVQQPLQLLCTKESAAKAETLAMNLPLSIVPAKMMPAFADPLGR